MYRVIIIDDSKFYRDFLKEVIDGFEEFTVIATAEDAYDAREKIKLFKPDLVTIDINMPKMDGIVFLRNLMRLHPMPAFIVSSEAMRHKEAYEDGALGFVEKTQSGENPQEFVTRLYHMLLNFTYLYDRYRQNRSVPREVDDTQSKISPDLLLASKPARNCTHAAIGIAASTGGIEAISALVSQLPDRSPPIFIVQHIPYGFSRNFIHRLSTLTALNVVEVSGSQPILPNTIYLASGNQHLTLSPSGKLSQMGFVNSVDGPRISRHRPSADIMFRGLTNTFGKCALGVILTGMGDDGVIGLKELHEIGGVVIAQDEATSVVFGMPKKAIEMNAVSEILPLSRIALRVREFALSNSEQ